MSIAIGTIFKWAQYSILASDPTSIPAIEKDTPYLALILDTVSGTAPL